MLKSIEIGLKNNYILDINLNCVEEAKLCDLKRGNL